MNREFFEALRQLEQEKKIPAEYLLDKISEAIITSVRRSYGGKDNVEVRVDASKDIFEVYLKKDVVEEVEDPDTQILLEDARRYESMSRLGDVLRIPLETKKFGRIAATTAKHVIRQGIREAEHGQVLQEFQSRQQELVSAVVQQINPHSGNVTVTIGRSEAILFKAEQTPGETYHEGDHIKVYIVDVKASEKGPRVTISRTHPGLVKRLFEIEVPEIYDGTVEIKAVSREAGSRTKLAVFSRDPNVDPIGACIGNKGVRVGKIVEELGGEKIDIVKYSDDPAAFIAEALSPATVLKVEMDPENPKGCRVTVPDNQLSLAIGNKGQNVRLAAKLTGWKIDIRPESGFYGEEPEPEKEEAVPQEETDTEAVDAVADQEPSQAEAVQD